MRNKKISGDAFDRLIFFVGPITVLLLTMEFFFTPSGQFKLRHIFYYILATLLLWVIDIFINSRQQFNALYARDAIYIEDQKISIGDIVCINPLIISISRWNIDALSLSVNDGIAIKQYKIMCKTNTLIRFIGKKKSPTYDLLFRYFPELEKKVGETIFL